MPELTLISALEIAALVRRKEVSPREVVQAHLERIERLNPYLNAFVCLDQDRALDAARVAEQAVMEGRELGPLHGVPITIKSSIDVAGLRSETGSRLRAGHIPTSDAPLVKRLKAAGAIVLGNTNAPEMLMAYETDNLIAGRTNNPWDLDRTPGGSSGGESAAIAAGLSAGGVGSDGGGSIRVPAHYTGICGLKPTPGRIPSTGHFPVSAGPFALIGVVGPMARTVGDLLALFEVMAGYDRRDPSAAPVPIRRWNEAEVRSTAIGYFEDDGRTPVTPETRAAVRQAAEWLGEDGFRVEPFRPENLNRIRELWWNLFGRAGGLILGPELAGRDTDLSAIMKEFRTMVAADPPLTLDDLMTTLLERDALRGRFLEEMQCFPILLCPVSSIPAFRHRERQWQIEGRTVRYLREPDVMAYTQWFNLLGNPAGVVPVGRSPEGLPIGVQVVGRPWEEERVLAVAGRIEAGAGGFVAPPPLR